jgi:hypothetical protein
MNFFSIFIYSVHAVLSPKKRVGNATEFLKLRRCWTLTASPASLSWAVYATMVGTLLPDVSERTISIPPFATTPITDFDDPKSIPIAAIILISD